MRRVPASDHIVDVLIAERIGGLMRSPAWPLLRPVLYALLDYDKARKLADDVGPLSGQEAIAHVSRMLDLKLEVTGLENVPRAGPLLIAANHPTGPADGIGVIDAVSPVRRDLHFYANTDTVRLGPGLKDTVIGVEWREGLRTREQARAAVLRTREIFETGQALFIFPAGRISRRTKQGLVDWPWQRTAVTLARKHGATLLPVFMTGPRTAWVHWLGRTVPALKDVTLFHEFLNTRGKRFRVVIGRPVAPEALGGDDAATIGALKAYVEQVLPRDPEAVFTPPR